MTLRQARDRAEQLLVQLGVDRAPVDVFKVARYLKIKVVLDSLDPDVSGLLITDQSGTRICVNGAHAETRRRFTIAHEIGHFVLGHHFEAGSRVHVDRAGVFVSARSPRSSQGVDGNEIEANQFASALLIPQFLLKAEPMVVAANVTDFDVELLSSKFKVSELAMTIRLTRLGFL
ncbi:MAG: ImmA/IrrE family metallo-endopeptidase [Archangium sp.]|nr:ImmA/IrrE family metallo-endopeptidase [Archangium sp.]